MGYDLHNYVLAVALAVIGGGVLIDLDHIPFLLGFVAESEGRFLHLPLLVVAGALLGGLLLYVGVLSRRCQ